MPLRLTPPRPTPILDLMLCAVRGSRLAVTAAALVLLAAALTSALPFLHSLGTDDACGLSTAEHNATAPRIAAATAPADSPHCPICHWWQSVGRFKGTSLSTVLTAFVDFGLVARSPAVEPAVVATTSRPARAPPAS
jgi:hypothetical protein